MKELLFSVTKNDLEIDWFSGTGCGGQYRNKHQNCCRIRHKDSGAIATGQSQRDRVSNLKEAMENLTKSPKFKAWVKVRVGEVTGEKADIEAKVDRAMRHLKFEVKDEAGNWKEVQEDDIVDDCDKDSYSQYRG